MQPALPFPAEVYRAAQAAGLGSPMREYSDGDQPVQKSGWLHVFTGRRLASFLSWLGFWLLVPLVGALLLGGIGLGFGAVVLHVVFPLNLVIASAILVVGLYLGSGMLYMMVDAMWPDRSIDRAVSRAWSCPDGVIYQQGKRFHALHWEQLATVTRQTALVDGNDETISYRVQPDGAPAFVFTRLPPVYARWIKPLRRSGGHTTISAGAVQVECFWEGSVLRISGTVDLSAFAGLDTLIEEQLVRQRLPALLDAYRSGVGVPFGSLVFSKHGVTDGAKALLWSELAALHVSQKALQITQKPTGLDWFYLSLLDVPNVALLLDFLAAIRGSQP
jgi:hypothetical protein